MMRVMASRLPADARAVLSTLLLLAAAVAAAQGGRIVFSEQSAAGQLWANLSLTAQRMGEPYLPMVVGVQNLGKRAITLDRSSFRLIGPDGRRYPMADLKTLRESYDKGRMDRRIASAAGIPIELWARQRNLRESNFFPDVGLSRRPTVIDRVSLGRRDGMVDLVYFVAPPGLAAGVPFALEVQPREEGAPMRLRLMLQ